MAIDVTVNLDIAAPPGVVAAIQFDPRRDSEWIGGVDRVELVTEPPISEGSQVRRFGSFMGRSIEWLMRVEAFEPGRHVGMHALRSPFPMDVDYRLEPIDDGRVTRASIRIRGEGRGMYGAMPGSLLGFMVRRSVQGDLQRLARLARIAAIALRTARSPRSTRRGPPARAGTERSG